MIDIVLPRRAGVGNAAAIQPLKRRPLLKYYDEELRDLVRTRFAVEIGAV